MTSPISSAIVPPEASVSEQARNEFQSKLAGLGGRQASPEAKAKKLREACEGFESIFIQKMWQEMRNTVPQTGFLHGREEKFWQDMYDQELSKSMTKAGGIGLADMMFEQLSRNLGTASRDAAGVVAQAPFTPAAAPLISPAQAQMELASAQPAGSVYDGLAPQTGSVPDGDGASDYPNQEHPKPQAAMNNLQQANAGAAAQAVAPAQSVAAAQPMTAAPPADSTPVHTAHHTKKADLNNSNAIDLAYLAKRDAGDKLGSRAVRPALRPKNQHAAKAVAPAASPVAEIPAPGSPQALAQALEQARTGAVASAQGSPLSMDDIVARAKARNAAAPAGSPVGAQAAMAGMPQQMAQAAQPVDGEAVPVTRKVRFSTNVPGKDKAKRGSQQAIRMLNVDNVSANSNAGKGLAAYHAAQQAAPEQPAPVSVPGGMQTGAPAAPIAPLRASEAGNNAADASFSIPPLTGSGLNG